LGAQLHQQLAKPISATAITAIGPISVVGRVLDEFGISRREQNGLKCWMLSAPENSAPTSARPCL